MNHRLLAGGTALVALVLTQPFRPFVVSGDSMHPTFETGQIIWANSRPTTLHRGDVVVFHHEGETVVKRVAYLPGDTIEQFWFAGEWQLASSTRLRLSIERQVRPRRYFEVEPGQLYVLGDNPFGSVDSRVFGTISDKDVIGIVPNVNADAQQSIEGARLGNAFVAKL